MKKQLRVTALIFAALFVLALVFSLAFMIAEADHDCTGEECQICRQLAVCVSVLRRMTVAVIIAAAVLLAVRAAVAFVSAAVSHVDCTPVLFKVKLLN